uniref:WGS project CBMI000000000 data, contig CS3069_c001572 n=1 Tax=Fusarium clavum TaxID=2594811 RepID=A0A090MFY8_9HYPO|nr:unnamed protein product [Fusarium clavum]
MGLLKIRGYNKAISILDEALLADSVEPANLAINAKKYGNKRLALIGDALLCLILVNNSIIGGASIAESYKICIAEASNAALYKD